MLREIFSCILIFSALTVTAQQKSELMTPVGDANIDYKQVGAPMPHIVLWTFDSVRIYKRKRVQIDLTHIRLVQKKPKMMKPKIIVDKDLNNKANLFVMMFNPTCGHCEDQTQLFERNINLFKKSKLVLMANPNMTDYLPNFIKSFKVKDFPQISIGVDSGSFIKETFLYSALPQINVYSPDRKLIRAFAGEVPIDSLKQYIQ